MAEYNYKKMELSPYIHSLYSSGLGKPKHATQADIEKLIEQIGLFKFKGYLYAFKNELSLWSIEDVLLSYFFDTYLAADLMSRSLHVETKLKTALVETAYAKTSNPFFYLNSGSYTVSDFKLGKQDEDGWRDGHRVHTEIYRHFREYYLDTYDFESNKNRHLKGATLIQTSSDVNYPPFHYLAEAATIGLTIEFVTKLMIGGEPLLKSIANKFGIFQMDVFVNYLKRLKEIRNRCAHGSRLFNRNYRSVKAFGAYQSYRANVSAHKIIDVYMTLEFLSDRLHSYGSYDKFEGQTIFTLIDEFKNDRKIAANSNGLVAKVDNSDFLKLMGFIMKGMGKK